MYVEFLKDCGVAVDGKGLKRADFKVGDVAGLQKGVALDLIRGGLAKNAKPPELVEEPETTEPDPDSMDIDPDTPVDLSSLSLEGQLTPEQRDFFTLNAMRDLVEDKKVTSSGKPDVRVIEELVRERLMAQFGAEVFYELNAKERDQLYEENIATE